MEAVAVAEMQGARAPGEAFEPPSAEDELWLWAEALTYYLERWYDVVVELTWAAGHVSLRTRTSPPLEFGVDDDQVLRVRVGYWFYAERPVPQDASATRPDEVPVLSRLTDYLRRR